MSVETRVAQGLVGMILGSALLGGWAWAATRLDLPPASATPVAAASPPPPMSNGAALLDAAAHAVLKPKAGRELAAWRRGLAAGCAAPIPPVRVRSRAAERNVKALKLLAEAAAKPALYVELQIPLGKVPPKGDAALEGRWRKPDTAGWEDVTRLAIVDARIALANGDVDLGFSRFGDILALGRRLVHTRGPLLIVPEAGVDLMHAALDALARDRRNVSGASAPALARFAARLEGLDKLEHPVGEIYTGERDFRAETLFNAHMAEAMAAAGEDELTASAGQWLGEAVAQAYRDAMDEVADRADVRDFRPPILADPPRNARIAGSTLNRIMHPLQVATLAVVTVARPASMRDAARVLAAEARFDALRLAVAAARYRLAHAGKAPVALGDLVPAFLPAVPADPFKPETYLRHQGGRLWSVGWDGRDDGGRRPRDLRVRDGAELALPGDLVLAGI